MKLQFDMITPCTDFKRLSIPAILNMILTILNMNYIRGEIWAWPLKNFNGGFVENVD